MLSCTRPCWSAPGCPPRSATSSRRRQRAAGFAAEVDLDGWPADRRTPVDGLLCRTARELLGNVVKHARARRVTVALTLLDGHARLTVTDDGIGVTTTDVTHRLGEGHIGLASHALRVEAAGGVLTLAPAPATGTVATAELPVPGLDGQVAHTGRTVLRNA